jgi:hypothetical protein
MFDVNAVDNPTLQTLVDSLGRYLTAMRSDPREEVILRYTKGKGRFDRQKRFITLTMAQFRFSGEQDGHHEGVWERQFERPEQLIARPANPQGPYNEPRGPVPHVPIIAQTKGVWVFEDDSAITAVGPALSHLVPLKGGGFLFTVTCAQYVTGGTGRYKGVRGLKTSLGSTFVPRGVDLFGQADIEFDATTVDTFRVVRAGSIRTT